MRLTLKFWKWFKKPDEAGITDMIVPEAVAQSKTIAKRVIAYKDPKITEFVKRVPYYIDINSHEIGDLVRLKNDALALITDVGNRKFPLIISPYRSDLPSLLDKLNIVREHQQLVNTDWPLQSDPRFKEKLQRIFANLGLRPEGANHIDPEACFKNSESIELKYYQKIVSTYSIYGPYRGVLVVHSMGTGKTCTAIAAIDNFLAFCKLEQETLNTSDPISDPVKIKEIHEIPVTARKQRRGPGLSSRKSLAAEAVAGGEVTPASVVSTLRRQKKIAPHIGGGATKQASRIFVVIPPRASLEQNFRSELSRCPSKIKEMILAQREKGSKDASAATNRIINQNMTIISYVTLSNRLKKGLLTIENCLLILDEAHNFLEPPKQFAAAYNYLYGIIKKTQNCKLILLTGTPIYKSVTDLPRLLNLLKRSNEEKFPETEDAFFKKYFTGNRINAREFGNDLKGYISYYDAENDLSVFAKKVDMMPIITHVTDDHYKKWLESRKTENNAYGFGDTLPPMADLVTVKNTKFKSPVSGYFKRSSAMTNVPLSYRKPGKFPLKFAAVVDQIMKYPKEKHFVFSRHAASGANALGDYMEQVHGWDRMSNNKLDHGSHPPTYFNTMSKELNELKNKKNSVSSGGPVEPFVSTSEKQSIIRRNLKKPYMGFVIANKLTTRRDIGYDQLLFNDTEDNVDGKLCRVFIADENFSEGMSLLNCLNVHILDEPYSYQALRQVMARAVRYCSHKQLKFPWEVKIFRYHASLDDTHPMTDDLIKNYSDQSQNILQQIIDTMVDNSIEAGFTNLHKRAKDEAVSSVPHTHKSMWQRFMELFRKKKDLAMSIKEQS